MTCYDPLYATSARVKFGAFKDVEFTTQSFVFPGITAVYPSISTPHMRLPFTPGALEYEKLILNFIIDDDLKNYKSIVTWLQQSLTKPEKLLKSDASVVTLSSLGNPRGTVSFKDVFPISISPINFQFNITDPQPLIATAVFDYTYYEFE